MSPGDVGLHPAPLRRDRAIALQRRRRRRIVLLVAIALVLVVLGAVGWFLAEAYPIGGQGAPAVFQVTDGESIGSIATTLQDKGIISSALAFRLDVDLQGAPTVVPGWYVAPTNASFSSVRELLSGEPNATAVAVMTAQSASEVGDSLLAAGQSTAWVTAFETLVARGGVASPYQPTPHGSLEGVLAPGVYVLSPTETPRTLVDQMVDRFGARAASVGLTPTTTLHGLDAYQLLTVASIVEKEGYYARNMPKVATVVFNRLARGTPLQMDATVEYAIGQDGGPVTHATESVNSPYNTYLHTGLTPTPICIPSTQALDATLHAPHGPWLFFTLVTHSGTMAFSSTFAEQLANERLAASRGIT